MCSKEQLQACNQHGGGYTKSGGYVSISTGVGTGYSPLNTRIAIQYKGSANPMYTGTKY